MERRARGRRRGWMGGRGVEERREREGVRGRRRRKEEGGRGGSDNGGQREYGESDR